MTIHMHMDKVTLTAELKHLSAIVQPITHTNELRTLQLATFANVQYPTVMAKLFQFFLNKLNPNAPPGMGWWIGANFQNLRRLILSHK
jgi:hypothetical protein